MPNVSSSRRALAESPWCLLLPIHGAGFVMRFRESSNPGFFHHAALASWLRTVLDGPDDFDRMLALDVPEQGRVRIPAGNKYRFRVCGIGERGRALIASIPGAAGGKRDWDGPMPFRDNWRCEMMVDWHFEQPLAEPACLLDERGLARACALLASQPAITLRFVTPWRVLKAREQRAGARGEARYCRDGADLVPGSLWLHRITDSLVSLIERLGGIAPQLPPLPELDASLDMFWVNHVYRRADGRIQPMGGLMGEIRLEAPERLPRSWLELLIMAQYLGTGQRRAFGNGCFRILDAEGCARVPLDSVVGWLDRAMDAANLRVAWDSVVREHEDDAEDPDEQQQQLVWDEDAVTTLAGRVLRGEYVVPAMHGFVREDADGGLRPLAAPPLKDRVLQRAVHQVLSPALDMLMSTSSFGYRTGRSRFGARDLIQRLYREGFRWVFESDIRSFFDAVDLERLRVRLAALLRDETLAEAVLAWMRASVLYKGGRIDRERGLPQGSPLSPLMANLMLDDFDHDLADAGCRLVRFADDFVIVAKSREAAARAGELARQALADLGLELNEEKTRVVPFSEGFRFLGFVFVDGLAVESSPRRSNDAGKVPEGSWLARAVQKEKQAHDEALASGEPVGMGHFEEAGQMLIFCGEPAVVMTRDGRVCIERDGERIHEAPWSHLDGLILFGRHHLTTPAIHEALSHAVPVHLATGAGRYRGAIIDPAGQVDGSLWMRQHECMRDEALALRVAVSLMDSRIRHMRETLRRRDGTEAALAEMDRALKSLSTCASREELNGIEGNATRAMFQAFRAQLDPAWGFGGRRRRPAPDPFNALLSFGYTMLYAYVDTLLRADGLLPTIGIYHRPRSGHAALASDMMEPFRHVVERCAFSMLQRRRLRPEDFGLSDQGCRLSARARRLYLAALAEALWRPVRARGASETLPVIQHVRRQHLALKFWLTGRTPDFQAWRMR